MLNELALTFNAYHATAPLESKQWFASLILCATPCTSRTGLATAGRFSLLWGPAVLMSRSRRQKGRATQLAQPRRTAPMRPDGSYRWKTGRGSQ
jgi:hypothetical protein